jgi:hypothetical protein
VTTQNYLFLETSIVYCILLHTLFFVLSFDRQNGTALVLIGYWQWRETNEAYGLRILVT